MILHFVFCILHLYHLPKANITPKVYHIAKQYIIVLACKHFAPCTSAPMPHGIVGSPCQKPLHHSQGSHKGELSAKQTEGLTYTDYSCINSSSTLKRSPSTVIFISPFCSCTRLFAMDNPKPLPSLFRELSPLTKRSISSSPLMLS